jgi:hypothetical protein
MKNTLKIILGGLLLILAIDSLTDACEGEQEYAEQEAEQIKNQLLEDSKICSIRDSWTIPYSNGDIKVTMTGLIIKPLPEYGKYNLITEFDIKNNSDKEVGGFNDFTISLFNSEEEYVKEMGIFKNGDWSYSSHYSDIGPMVEKTWQYGYFVTSGTYYVVISNKDPRASFGRDIDNVYSLIRSGDAVINKIVIE